jgi:hypothetical protein
MGQSLKALYDQGVLASLSKVLDDMQQGLAWFTEGYVMQMSGRSSLQITRNSGAVPILRHIKQVDQLAQPYSAWQDPPPAYYCCRWQLSIHVL